MFNHCIQRIVVHQRGVNDLVKASLTSHLDRVCAAAVPCDLDAKAVGDVTNDAQLFHREGHHFAFASAVGQRTGDVNLDPVAADLDLPAHLRNDLVFALQQNRISHRAAVRHKSSGSTADRGHQGIAAHSHAGSFDHAMLDGLLQIDAQIEQRVGVKKTGTS